MIVDTLIMIICDICQYSNRHIRMFPIRNDHHCASTLVFQLIFLSLPILASVRGVRTQREVSWLQSKIGLRLGVRAYQTSHPNLVHYLYS